MSTRPQFSPYIVIPNAGASPANTGSMAANITSVATVIQKLSMMSYEVSWTGTSPVGTVSVQVSDSYVLNPDGTVKTAGNWNVVPFQSNGSTVTAIPVSGNSGTGYIDIDQIGAYAIRIIYTAGSGTGTLQAIINAKVA